MRGGRIAGPQAPVTEAALNQNRDWPVLTDYRALIGGVLQRTHGLSAASLQQVFPGVAPVDLGLG